MEFIENFKLGALQGISAIVVLGTVALVVLAALVVLIINGVKAVKESKDKKEDEFEDAFFAEYGVTGEEIRLNERLAAKRERLRTRRRVPDVKWKVVETVLEVPGAGGSAPQEQMDCVPVATTFDDEVIYPIPATVFDDEEVYSMEHMTVFEDNGDTVFLPERLDEEDEIYSLEEYTEPAEAAKPAAEEKKEEQREEPVRESAAAATDPLYPLPINEDIINEYYYTPSPEPQDDREEDWSNYNGNFAGFYYDPYDACYHEGYAPRSLVSKLVAKQEEYNETYPDKGKKYSVVRINPPYMPLETPKHERAEVAPVEGFDEAGIYGKYIIEHVELEDGSEEYYYTLYSSSGEALYESDNYSSLEYCKRGIKRFKVHVKLGLFTINASGGKFYYVLTRKQYVHKGIPKAQFEEATALIKKVKNYYGTMVVREQ